MDQKQKENFNNIVEILFSNEYLMETRVEDGTVKVTNKHTGKYEVFGKEFFLDMIEFSQYPAGITNLLERLNKINK